MAFLNEHGLSRLWTHIIAKLNTKIDKEEGKTLSTNDFTDEYKDKLENISDDVTNLNALVGDTAVSEQITSVVDGALANYAELNHDHTEYATKDAPTFTSSINMGRKSGTEVGYNSIALGNNATASLDYTFAIGDTVSATNYGAFAIGTDTVASGKYSYAEGYQAKAPGYIAHAEGAYTEATADYSHAEGNGTIASGVAGQHVQGNYNIKDEESKYLHIVGNGESDNSRSNAHTVDKNGNAWFAGKVYVGGTSMDDAAELGSQETIIAKDANADGNIVLTNYVSDSYAEHIGDVGNPHNVTIDQIGAAPAGYGLGETNYASSVRVRTLAEVDALVHNGWYQFDSDGNDYVNGVSTCSIQVITSRWGITQIQYVTARNSFNGVTAIRSRYDTDSWNGIEWEYINPPMEIGVEYRTTERINGKTVYKKNVDGVIQYRLDGSTEWKPYSNTIGAAPAGYGLGAESGRQCADCYSVNEGGFWYVDSNTANVPEGISNGVMLVEINARGDKYLTIKEGPYMVKCYYSTYAQQWQPWEWVNPFLYPDVEYRTIERHNSYVVYKKNIGGIIHCRLGSSSTEWKPYSSIIGAASEAKTHTVTVNSSFVNSGSITANSVNGVLKVGGYLQTKAQHSSGGATTIICTIPGVKVSGNTYAVMIDHDHNAKAYNILLFTNESGNTVVQIEGSSTSIAASTWLNFSVLGVLA